MIVFRWQGTERAALSTTRSFAAIATTIRACSRVSAYSSSRIAIKCIALLFHRTSVLRQALAVLFRALPWLCIYVQLCLCYTLPVPALPSLGCAYQGLALAPLGHAIYAIASLRHPMPLPVHVSLHIAIATLGAASPCLCSAEQSFAFAKRIGPWLCPCAAYPSYALAMQVLADPLHRRTLLCLCYTFLRSSVALRCYAFAEHSLALPLQCFADLCHRPAFHSPPCNALASP